MLSLFIIFNLLLKCSPQIHYLSINENDSVPRHLLTFNSPNLHTSYTIITSDFQEYFSLKNQSDFYTIKSFDREYLCKTNICSCLFKCSIQLKILSQPENQILILNLTINDLNDNFHYFPLNQIELFIPENVNSHQCYRIPSVIDEDLFETNQISYRLIGDDHHQFEINQNLCLTIRNNSSLDREKCQRYNQLWIIAEDQLKQQAKLRILIEVLDINDNSPKFFRNSTILHVNETFFGQLICLTASDPDEGNNGRIVYSFEHLNENLLNYFSLNNQTGCITIIEPLLLTSIDLISSLQLNNRLLITIRAQDLGSKMSSTLPSYHQLELIINDINDHKPFIQIKKIHFGFEILMNNSNLTIQENTIGSLAMISIEDIDQGDIQLNFIVQSEFDIHQQAFRIKSNSNKYYKIELISPLDYEIESSFDLYFQAIDSGGETTSFILNIFIENQNDEKPEFERDFYSFIINIQSPNLIFNSTFIGQVHAIDNDSPNNNLIYYFNSTTFQIHPQTGIINLIQPLSINMTDQIIKLNVYVTDGQLIGKTNVTIFIQGYNHSPRFLKELFYFEIYENLRIRTIIGQINAKDIDQSSTPRGILTYSLRSITSYSEFFFHITHQGEIVVTRTPDAEQQQIHEFIVLVKDQGTPPLQDQTKLRIKITDINEYCPKLINKSSEPYLFISREYFSSKLFTYQLSAYDNDTSDQLNIKFRLLPSGFSHLFYLNSNGLLILKRFPSKIPLTIELLYSLSDQFFPKPCITKEKLILFIGETFDECQSLLQQYFQKSQFIISEKNKPSDIHSIIFIFSSCILIVLMSILYLILTLCCYRRKRLSQIIKPSLLINYAKQPSPHSFMTKTNC